MRLRVPFNNLLYEYVVLNWSRFFYQLPSGIFLPSGVLSASMAFNLMFRPQGLQDTPDHIHFFVAGYHSVAGIDSEQFTQPYIIYQDVFPY